MVGEWRETTLDQLGRIITGKTPPVGHPEYFGGDIPFVTPTDMDGRRILHRTGRYLTQGGAKAVSIARIPARAVMVSCTGSNGKAALAGRDCVTNQQINSIIVESGDDPLFVYYNLSSRKKKSTLQQAGPLSRFSISLILGDFQSIYPRLKSNAPLPTSWARLTPRLNLTSG